LSGSCKRYDLPKLRTTFVVGGVISSLVSTIFFLAMKLLHVEPEGHDVAHMELEEIGELVLEADLEEEEGEEGGVGEYPVPATPGGRDGIVVT